MKLLFTSFLLLPCAALAADTNALPALAPPYDKMPPSFWEQYGTVMFTGGFILLALAAIVLWQILKPSLPPELPPEKVAREALTKLLRRPEDGKCLSEISQILRRYMIAAFGLPTGETTTAEFCAKLAGNEKISAELAQAISAFLHECDERKFSPMPSSVPLNAVHRALELMKLVEQRFARSAPVPGAATPVTLSGTGESSRHRTSGVAASGDGRTP